MACHKCCCCFCSKNRTAFDLIHLSKACSACLSVSCLVGRSVGRSVGQSISQFIFQIREHIFPTDGRTYIPKCILCMQTCNFEDIMRSIDVPDWLHHVCTYVQGARLMFLSLLFYCHFYCHISRKNKKTILVM